MRQIKRSFGVLGTIAVLFVLVVLLGASRADAQNYSYRIFDIRSPLSQDILNTMLSLIRDGKAPNFATPDLENITEGVQRAAQDYEIQPGLLLALMTVEEDYPGTAQARLYYFNLDMGSLANPAIFPIAWFDAERVARAYTAEFERYETPDMAIAAYLVGHTSNQLPADRDASRLPQALRNHVTNVLNRSAEWSHLGERNAPQIVESNNETPPTSFEAPQVDISQIEASYVQNMMHFNPRLDEDTGHEIFESIRTHAEEFPDVDARLVMALVACESSFRPEARSRCGAQGLGQLMPFTAEHFGVSDPYDIDENIGATFAYLQREIERWSDNNYPLDRVLAAYNAGPGAVEQYTNAPYNGIPPYDETINYVRKVVNIYYYLLPEDERTERLSGQSRHVTQANGVIRLAS